MKQNIIEANKKKWLVIIPILSVIFIMPLIIRLRVIELSPEVQELWIGQKLASDIFSYYKMLFLLICSAVLALGFVLNHKQVRKVKPNAYILLLASYAVLTILSTVFSAYKEIAVFGFVDRFEGVFVILAYMLLTLGCIIFIEKEWEAAILYKGLAISAAVIGLIGVFQLMGYDIFRTEMLKTIITPTKYRGLSDLAFDFKPHAVYSTLQNPNYIGSYMAMLFPISAILFITSSGKKHIALYGLLSCVVFTALLGSLSRAGILGALASTILLIAFYGKKIMLKKFRLIPLTAFLTVVFVLVSFYGGFKLSEGSSQYLTNKRSDKISETAIIKNIELQHDSIKITSNRSELIIAFKENHLSFTDQNGKALKIKQNGEIVTFEDVLFSQYKLTILEKSGIIRVGIENLEISFAYTKKSGFKVLKGNGTLAAIDYPASIGFSQNQGFASSRGYIWSRTIPILKSTPLIGNGPDTFAASFPQNDFIGKLNVFRTIDVIIDKPHNMYLQAGVNTGVLSLAALLILYLLYLWDSFKLYRSCSLESKLETYGLCSFLAVLAYLVAGLINDSTISVAPVFWILLGTGIAINKSVRAKRID